MTKQTKTFVSLIIAHTLVDCYGGFWPMFKYIAKLDLWTAGLVTTITLFIGSATQPLFGVWADGGHRRRFVIAGSALASLGIFFGTIGLLIRDQASLAVYAVCFALMLVIRIGQSMFHPAGASLAGNLIPERRSMCIALFVSFGMLGFAMTDAFFSIVHRLTGGHTHWFLAPAILVVLGSIVWCRPEVSRRERATSFSRNLRVLVILRKQLVGLFLVQTLVSGLVLGVIFLMPEFLTSRGYPDWLVYGGGKLTWIAGGVAFMVPIGHFADLWGTRRVLMLTTTIACLLFYVMALTSGLSVPAFVLICFVTGGCMGTINPLGVSLGQQLSPRHASVISGILMGLAWATSSFSPLLVGTLAELPWAGPSGALAILGIAGPLALVCVVFAPTHSRQSKLIRNRAKGPRSLDPMRSGIAPAQTADLPGD